MTTFHLGPDKRTTLHDAAARVHDGDTVALGGGLCSRLPMALVRELIRQGRRNLRLVGSAHSIDADVLIAANVASICEESYVGFEQDLGLAPAFRRGVEGGTLEVRESSCVTMLTQLRAAEMGVPFLPVRGLLGTDLPSLHPEWGTVVCPFTGETLAAVPAISPDVALIHAPLGDAAGNLHFDQPYVLDERFAHASKQVVATVERIVDTDELVDAGVTLPAHTVSAIVEVSFGAHPSSCYPEYAYDRDHLSEYVAAASAGGERLQHYLDTYVLVDEPAYRSAVKPERLRSWSVSDAAWKEFFR